MLPEALSNELCSLKPDVERACLAAHLWIDAEGNLTRHRFVRGLMRSAARLTYEEVQAAIDGNPDDTTRALVEPVLRPLYGAYRALDKARRKRGTLDLDLPERSVAMNEAGRIDKIEPRPRYDSPQADRGIHDRRQCRGRRDVAEIAPALHVSGPRRARPGEARGAARFPDRAAHPGPDPRQGPGDPAAAFQPDSRARRRHAAGRDDQHAGAAESGASGLQPRQYRPFRPRPARLRAFHLADPALCRSPRASRADRRVIAGTMPIPPIGRPTNSPPPASISR